MYVKISSGLRKKITEQDYEDLERLSTKLKMPIPQVHLRIQTSVGRIKISDYRQRSHTWVRNYWNWLIMSVACQAGVATNFGAGYLSLKSTGAAVAARSTSDLLNLLNAPINNSNYGILAGYGTTAESFEAYNLATQCIHGSSANQLVHAAMSANVQTYTAGTKTWILTLKRLFNNNSGNTINISEAAIVSNNNAGVYTMFNRDLLGTPQAVANGAQLTVSYDISLVFPN
jgi:hypothetical protein